MIFPGERVEPMHLTNRRTTRAAVVLVLVWSVLSCNGGRTKSAHDSDSWQSVMSSGYTLGWIEGHSLYLVTGQDSTKNQYFPIAFNSATQNSTNGRFISGLAEDGAVILADTKGNVVWKSTFGNGDSPSPSPDGEKIAYQEVRSGVETGLELLHWRSGKRVLVARSANSPTWLADSGAIVFETSARLFLYDLKSTRVTEIGSGRAPAACAAGNQLAFATAQSDGIRILTLPTSEPVSVVTGETIVNGPRWSPQCNMLFYVRRPGAFENASDTSCVDSTEAVVYDVGRRIAVGTYKMCKGFPADRLGWFPLR